MKRNDVQGAALALLAALLVLLLGTRGSWGELSTLLPVRLSGYGGHMPRLRQGVVCQEGCSVGPLNQNDEPVSAADPVFRIYQNDELVWEKAALEENGQYECPAWELDYALGGAVRMAFACADRFGLGYEFLLDVWTFDRETPENQVDGSGGGGTTPILTWPE